MIVDFSKAFEGIYTPELQARTQKAIEEAKKMDNCVKVIERDFVHEDDESVLSHQIATDGTHRLVDCSGTLSEPNKQVPGEWVKYSEVARIKSGSREYAATTDYYGDILPRVFRLDDVRMTTSDRA